MILPCLRRAELKAPAKGRRKPRSAKGAATAVLVFSLFAFLRSSEDVLRSDAPKELVFRTEYPLDAQQLRLGFENERPTTYADDVFTLLELGIPFRRFSTK